MTPDSRPPAPDPRLPARRRGSALVMAMVALLVVSMVAAAIFQSLLAAHRLSKRFASELQAQWLAAAALDRATAQLARQSDYRGETWKAPISIGDTADSGDADFGQVTITVEASGSKKIIVEAAYPPDEEHRVLVRRELTIPAPKP